MTMQPDSVTPNVGQRIRDLREGQGLSLRALAKASGLSLNAISLIERGENSPTVSSLHALATALGVSIVDFFQTRPEQAVVYTQPNQRLSSGTTDDRFPAIEDLRWAYHPVGITLYDVRHVVIQNVTVQGYRLDGINAHDNAFDIELRNVTCRANGRSGLSVGGASRVDLSGSTLVENNQAQVRTEGYATLIVSRSTLGEERGLRWERDGGQLVVNGEPVTNVAPDHEAPDHEARGLASDGRCALTP